ncbi:hypothetical protein HG15A2_14390 [Adhaeretor mobilis]|uniref:Uncharacterized protein n=1 Tax=Adhaeretor mobilis TaxID=1930276 RepID=A0A517MTG5_9BACT|nr:hypothetical protein HG15A2_14390 [Adhaeretor mobilis]
MLLTGFYSQIWLPTERTDIMDNGGSTTMESLKSKTESFSK